MNDESVEPRWIRVIVNGKAASDPLLRPAIARMRDAGGPEKGIPIS